MKKASLIITLFLAGLTNIFINNSQASLTNNLVNEQYESVRNFRFPKAEKARIMWEEAKPPLLMGPIDISPLGNGRWWGPPILKELVKIISTYTKIPPRRIYTQFDIDKDGVISPGEAVMIERTAKAFISRYR